MDIQEQFIRFLTEKQGGLYAYIYTMIRDHSKAKDVLQEATIVMWRKINDFDGKNFEAWAMTTCKFQVMAFFRDQKRDRLMLNPKVNELLSNTAEQEYQHFNDSEVQLQQCLEALPDHCRELIDMRYFKNLKMNEIALKVEKKVAAVKMSLLRVRNSLLGCIEEKLKLENDS
jgi:RNA polymerase sigma-70 factor (ECF subfamily)